MSLIMGNGFKEDLEGLDDFTSKLLTFRVAEKVKKRLKVKAQQDGRKPDPHARHLLEISLGFRRPEAPVEFHHVQPLLEKKASPF